MAEPLSDHLPRLAADLTAAPRVLLLSDFDGTLVPIKERPELCELAPAARNTLTTLMGVTTATGIVSGRGLADLRPRVGVDGLCYAGNHGLEAVGPGFHFRHPAVSRTDLEAVLTAVGAEVSAIPGAWVEDKGLTASVHYRQVAEADIPAVKDAVTRVMATAESGGQFVLRSGKAVVEIRPAVDWNKGAMARWLADKFAGPEGLPYIVYFGDDDTDEDVFKMLADGGIGMGVSVGDRPTTAAEYRVNDFQDVHASLVWLAETLTHRGAPGGG